MDEEKNWKHHKKMYHHGSGNMIWFAGFVGALFYFLPQAKGLEQVLVGIVKALFWPGVLVFKALELLKV